MGGRRLAVLVSAVVAVCAHFLDIPDPQDDTEWQETLLSESEHHSMFQSTTGLLSRSFPGMLDRTPRPKHFNYEPGDVLDPADTVPDDHTVSARPSGGGGTKSILAELHEDLLSHLPPSEASKVPNIRDKANTPISVHNHPTQFNISSNLSTLLHAKLRSPSASLPTLHHANRITANVHSRIDAPMGPSASHGIAEKLIESAKASGHWVGSHSHVLADTRNSRGGGGGGAGGVGAAVVVVDGGGSRRVRDVGEKSLARTLTTEGVHMFSEDITRRTLRIVMEDNHVTAVRDHHGREIGATQQSTFFIMPILKLIIAPFVCIIMMVVIGPAEGGMKNQAGTAIVKGAGGPLAEMLAKIIGFILGILLAWIMGNVISEAATFQLTTALTFIICNNVFEQTAMDTVDNLSVFFLNTLLPALQTEVIGYIVDILSDALHSSLHHTVTRSVSSRLSKSLTPATLHYYYCIYCYYYGDYCSQCFHNNEQSIIDQLTWTNFGS